MSSERHRRVSELFLRACDLDAGACAAFLDRECGADRELRRDIDALLARDDRRSWSGGGDLLDRSVRAQIEEPPLPETLAQYQVIRRLGEGGMGEVFLVEQLEPVRRLMALKLVRQGLDTREVIARFQTERQALAMMSHPNIAQVYEAGATEQGRPYFAMEHVEGSPVTVFCDAEKLGIRERLSLFVDVCNGVQHAHQKGVIHRDIKPSNILVQIQDDRPVPKIIDFGIAKATDQRLSERSFFTHAGVLIGTPEYMSPEQAQGSADVDTRTDVYSLGLVLYELLVGALPLDARSLRKAGYLELCRMIQENPTSRPSERLATLGEGAEATAINRKLELSTLRRRVRGDLDWIVLKALEKNPERRYRSASELAEDLLRHLDNHPVLAGPPSVQYKLGKFVRRHRMAVAAASMLAVFGLVFAVTVSVQLRVQARERLRAETEARKAERVVQFLREMLAAPSVEKLGPDARLLDALDAAAEGAISGLSDEPEVEAVVRETIGITYRSLSAFEKADRELTQALEIRRQVLPQDDPDLAGSHHELGSLRFAQQRLPEAQEELGRALEIYRANPESDSERIAVVMGDLGAAHTGLGHYKESEKLLREAIRILEADTGQSVAVEESLATVYENLAGVMLSSGRLDQAEVFVRNTLETKRRISGGQANPGVATSLHNLAFILARRGAHDEAIPLFQECIAMEIQLVGTRQHLRVSQPIEVLGRSYMTLGRYAEAERFIREALSIQRTFRDADAPGIARTLSTLGVALSEQGKHQEATVVAHDASQTLLKSDSASPGAVTRALTNESVFLERAGHLEQAEERFREAISRGEAAYPLSRLALLLIRQGRLEEAESLVTRERAAMIRERGPEHPSLGTMLSQAKLHHARGELDAAEAIYRKAVRARTATRGDNHPRVAAASLNLAQCLRDAGRLEEALPLARDALRIWQAGETAPLPQLAQAREILAQGGE